MLQRNMDKEEAKTDSVYGRNLPEGEGREVDGVREQSTEQELDSARNGARTEGNLAGRGDKNSSQGEFHRDDEQNEKNPKPPRHAPGSEEVPS